MRSGRGHYKWANGDEYEGEWKNDMPDGEGSLAMVDGTRYQGVFSKGKYDGKGIHIPKYTWFNGTIADQA